MRRMEKIKKTEVKEAEVKEGKRVNQSRNAAVKAALILCLSVILSLGSQPAVTALAADTGLIDLKREGSITVTLLTDDGEAVADGSLTIYKAADLELPDWNMSYVYTDDFAGIGEVPYDTDSADYSKLLARWAADNGVSGAAAEAGADGNVIFDGLTAGVYLIAQTEDEESRYTMNPFVVTLPMDEEGIWVYDIAAIPKTEIIVEKSEMPQEPEEPEDETGAGTEPGVPDSGDESVTEIAGSSLLPQTGELYRPLSVMILCIASLAGAVWLLRRERNHAS